jgi:hypothetical protein
MEDMFDGVVRERLKEVLRQYELRERHFECVIRSKELEVLLSRARAAEQKQLSEGEKARADKSEEEVCCCFETLFSAEQLICGIERSASERFRNRTERSIDVD